MVALFEANWDSHCCTIAVTGVSPNADRGTIVTIANKATITIRMFHLLKKCFLAAGSPVTQAWQFEVEEKTRYPIENCGIKTPLTISY